MSASIWNQLIDDLVIVDVDEELRVRGVVLLRGVGHEETHTAAADDTRHPHDVFEFLKVGLDLRHVAGGVLDPGALG